MEPAATAIEVLTALVHDRADDALTALDGCDRMELLYIATFLGELAAQFLPAHALQAGATSADLLTRFGLHAAEVE